MSIELERDPNCGVCAKLSIEQATRVLFENELWQVRAADPPTAVPGWTMLISRRHVAGPAQFNAREVASFGPTWVHLQRVLRFAKMPKDAKAWAVFDLQRAAAAGEIEVDEGEALRVSSAYARALQASPPLAL